MVLSRVVSDFVDGGDKLGTADGRLQCRDKQTVIAAGLTSGNGARRVAADSIGYQPLAGFGRVQIAADFPAKLNFRLFGHRRSFQATVKLSAAIEDRLVQIHCAMESFSYSRFSHLVIRNRSWSWYPTRR